jgi:hypothetical protein
MATNADHTSGGVASIFSSGRDSRWSTGVALRRLRRILASWPLPDKSGGPPIHSRTILKPPRARNVYRSIAAQNSVGTYFPEFERAVEELQTAGLSYGLWMLEARQKTLQNKPEALAGHEEIAKVYVEKRESLLTELKSFARGSFNS